MDIYKMYLIITAITKNRYYIILYYTSTILYYTILVLYYTILYYTILYYTSTILYYTILYYTILHYTSTILYYAILYYTSTILYYTSTTLCYTILYFTILYYTSTILQYTSTVLTVPLYLHMQRLYPYRSITGYICHIKFYRLLIVVFMISLCGERHDLIFMAFRIILVTKKVYKNLPQPDYVHWTEDL
uniref:Uncharacterized protein n=1 Tax=Glossina pallidipes TaxID=7398 RepID=A0A1A9Z3H0_GLOPL